MILKIKKLDEDVRVPEFAYKDDAGMDIFSNEDILNPIHIGSCNYGGYFQIDNDRIYIGADIYDSTPLDGYYVNSMKELDISDLRQEHH